MEQNVTKDRFNPPTINRLLKVIMLRTPTIGRLYSKLPRNPSQMATLLQIWSKTSDWLRLQLLRFLPGSVENKSEIWNRHLIDCDCSTFFVSLNFSNCSAETVSTKTHDQFRRKKKSSTNRITLPWHFDAERQNFPLGAGKQALHSRNLQLQIKPSTPRVLTLLQNFSF